MDIRVGQQLGNYRLIRLIGQGGFADVYLGEHIHLKTQAALKILQTRLSNDELERFLDEARTIAHLDHPNIVRVLDYGREDQTPFLVMSYAPNGTLRLRHPKEQRVPVEQVVSYVQQVASALDYAHQQKLIHRDIKPENMLLGQHNEVLLGDFGLATLTHSGRSRSLEEVAGTAVYMAPEQLQGKPSRLSDQYSLGIIVYEWLSGERPFQGAFAEVASQHLLTPPPPLYGRIPGISAEVERVVFIALAKDPQQRFPTVQAFATALAQACNRGQDIPPQSDRTYSTNIMNPSNQSSALIHNNPSLNQSLQSSSIITPPNQVQPSAGIPSQRGQLPQQPPITPSNLSSQPMNMNPLPPYEQKNNKKRNNLSKGRVAVLIGLVLLVLGGMLASFIIQRGPTTAATSTPTPSRGTGASTTAPSGRTATSITTPSTTPSLGAPRTVIDDMQSPNSPGYDPNQTHRADYAHGSPNQVLFITNMNINGDNTLAERSSATASPPYIVWRCSNITAFTAITYFYHYNGEPEFTFQKSTSPITSSNVQWVAIPGIDAPPTNGPTSSPGWIMRTYSLKNLSGVNFIEIGWGNNPQATTNLTPLIGKVTMTCSGGF